MVFFFFFEIQKKIESSSIKDYNYKDNDTKNGNYKDNNKDIVLKINKRKQVDRIEIE